MAVTVGTDASTVLDFAESVLEVRLPAVLADINTEKGLSLTVPLRYRRSELVHRDFVTPEVSLYVLSEEIPKIDGLSVYDMNMMFVARLSIAARGQIANTEKELFKSLCAYGHGIAHVLQRYLRDDSGKVVYMCHPRGFSPYAPELRDTARSQWIQTIEILMQAKYRLLMREE